jgi:hypothetical protein
MSVQTTVFPGEHRHPIWRDEHGQEVLGPATASITVENEPDLCPYPALRVSVRLRDGRYDVDELEIRSYDGPPITVRGLQTIRFGAILRHRDGLIGEVTIRRTTADGRTVTGVGRDDEIPLVYVFARAVGENPTQAVQEAFELPSRQAAAQRVARLRKAGRIPPTTKGAR